MQESKKEKLLYIIKSNIYFEELTKEEVMKAVDEALEDIEEDKKLTY